MFEPFQMVVPAEFQDRLNEHFGDQTTEQEETVLIELADMEERLRESCDEAALRSGELLSSLLPEVLEAARAEMLTIPHIRELAILLQWDPLPIPSDLQIRYPRVQAGGRRNAERDDVRKWFAGNFRPLPLPEELSGTSDWTLQD